MQIWKWGFNLLILFSNVCIVEDCQHTIYKFLFCLVMSTILYEFNFTIGDKLWMFIMLIKKPRKRVFSQKEWIRTSQHHVMIFHVISFMIVIICKYFFFHRTFTFYDLNVPHACIFTYFCFFKSSTWCTTRYPRVPLYHRVPRCVAPHCVSQK